MLRYLVVNTLFGVLFSSEPPPREYVITKHGLIRSHSDSELIPFRYSEYRSTTPFLLAARVRRWERYVTRPLPRSAEHKCGDGKYQ